MSTSNVRPTRITSSTASLIDNIFTNEPTNCAVSGLLVTDISDHLPIFSISNECQTSSRKTLWLTFREKNANNVSKFKDELQTVNWSEVRDSSDPSSAYDIFLRKYTDIYNKCFPLKKVKIKNNGLTKPWISKALLKSIKKKNFLYRRFFSFCPHIQNWTRKISKSLGIIYKSSFCLNKNSLYTLYYSLVYPYLYYCTCVWGLTYHSNLKRLVTLQTRAVRSISRSAFDAHTDPIFKSLKLLKFENIVFLQVAKIMYIYKTANSLKVSKTCFSLDEKYTTIIPEIKIFFVCPLVEQMYENSPYDFKDPKFLIQ